LEVKLTSFGAVRKPPSNLATARSSIQVKVVEELIYGVASTACEEYLLQGSEST